MRVLITGGAGFIGSNLTETLLKHPQVESVRVFDNLITGKLQNIRAFNQNEKFEFIEADIRNFKACLQAMEGIDAISHQAALGSVPRSINDPLTTNEVNVSGTLNIFTAAKERNIKRVVYAASSSTYGDHPGLPKVEDTIGNPLSPYAVTKYVNELYAKVYANVYGLELIGLRYFNVFGPKQDPDGAYAAVIPLFMKAVLNNEPPIINGDGEHSRDFTFVDNAVQANVKALFTNDPAALNQVYNIACGEQTTLNELFGHLKQIAGSDLAPKYGAERAGDVRNSLADISKSKKYLNYNPDISVKEGLKMHLNGIGAIIIFPTLYEQNDHHYRGAGFIGSHVVRLFVAKYPDYKIINLDALTYAGNLENLQDIEKSPNYFFEKVNLLDVPGVEGVFEKYSPNGVIHLAAESHVDRSILSPLDFVYTNIVGTVNLLNTVKKHWAEHITHLDHTKGAERPNSQSIAYRFYHVSTDEVYGALGETGLFTETTPYDPNSPYSASKAASDHFVRAYGETYHLPYIISNCSNNYGPNHFPEKLIPLFINNIINKKPLPVYGDGLYTRDWLFVKDHATAIDLAFHKGKTGETYNIGGFNEWKNIDLVKLLCKQMDEKLGNEPGTSDRLITYIKDRPGHDRRYAIDATKINKELGWQPTVTFEEGLSQTIDWYLENKTWLKNVTSGEYLKYYKEMYAHQ